MDRTAFIKQHIEQGKDREAVRRELISIGESTAGLEEEYAALIAELKIPEPKPPVPDYVAYTANPSAAPVSVAMPSLFACIGYGLQLAFSQWKAVLVSCILLVLPIVLLALVPPMFLIPPVVVGIIVLYTFVSVVVTGAFLYTLVFAYEREVHFVDALSWGASRFFSLLWLCVVMTFLLLGATLFFVIPAIFISIFVTFTIFAFIKEDARGMRALLRSYDLIKGNFLKVSLLLLLLTLLSLFGGVLAALLMLMPLPFVNIASFMLVQLFVAAICVGALLRMYTASVQQRPLFDLSSYGGVKWTYRLLALLGLVAVCMFVFITVKNDPSFLQKIPINVGSEFTLFEGSEALQLNVIDTLTKSKVDTTAASAKLYHGRMGFYDGVCDDITVVSPVVCKNSTEYFMIYAPVSANAYYCVDSYNFTGTVARVREDRCE